MIKHTFGMAMTNKTGKVVWRADELLFGEEYQTQEMPERNDRRFLGKQLDKETGLVYMGARYLDPRTGRFTQPDPVGCSIISHFSPAGGLLISFQDNRFAIFPDNGVLT